MSTEPLTTPQAAPGCIGGVGLVWWPIAEQGHLQWSCPADPLWHNTGIWTFLTTGTPARRSTRPQRGAG